MPLKAFREWKELKVKWESEVFVLLADLFFF